MSPDVRHRQQAVQLLHSRITIIRSATALTPGSAQADPELWLDACPPLRSTAFSHTSLTKATRTRI
eukprot:882003-Pyramimonas_sp.AAC.1